MIEIINIKRPKNLTILHIYDLWKSRYITNFLQLLFMLPLKTNNVRCSRKVMLQKKYQIATIYSLSHWLIIRQLSRPILKAFQNLQIIVIRYFSFIGYKSIKWLLFLVFDRL